MSECSLVSELTLGTWNIGTWREPKHREYIPPMGPLDAFTESELGDELSDYSTDSLPHLQWRGPWPPAPTEKETDSFTGSLDQIQQFINRLDLLGMRLQPS